MGKKEKNTPTIYFSHVAGKVDDIIYQFQTNPEAAPAHDMIDLGEGDSIDDVPIFMQDFPELSRKLPMNLLEELLEPIYDPSWVSPAAKMEAAEKDKQAAEIKAMKEGLKIILRTNSIKTEIKKGDTGNCGTCAAYECAKAVIDDVNATASKIATAEKDYNVTYAECLTKTQKADCPQCSECLIRAMQGEHAELRRRLQQIKADTTRVTKIEVKRITTEERRRMQQIKNNRMPLVCCLLVILMFGFIVGLLRYRAGVRKATDQKHAHLDTTGSNNMIKKSSCGTEREETPRPSTLSRRRCAKRRYTDAIVAVL